MGRIIFDVAPRITDKHWAFAGACTVVLGLCSTGINLQALAGDITRYTHYNHIDDFSHIPDDVIINLFNEQHITVNGKNIAASATALLDSVAKQLHSVTATV